MPDLIDKETPDDDGEDRRIEVIPIKPFEKELNFLSAYWEVRNRAQIVAWAVCLLEDLTKLDEADWRVILTKVSDKHCDGVNIKRDKTYNDILIRVGMTAPIEEGYRRLLVDAVEKITKIKSKQVKQ